MAQGSSGRVVLKIDPALKRELYVRPAVDGRSLKSWFLERTDRYLRPAQQYLPFAALVLRAAEPTERSFGQSRTRRPASSRRT